MRHVLRSPGLPAPQRAWLPYPAVQPVLQLILICVLLSALMPRSVFALNPGDLTFTLITPFMAQDSNDSCNAGPKAMYIEVLVTNPASGTGSISNLTANLSPFAGLAGVTLDSGESATRYIGTLADGASFPLYFYINYPCQAGSNPPPISSTFTVTASDGVTAPLTSGTLTLTTRSELSANAGGQVLSSTIGPGAVVGQIIPMTVNYDFGNPGGVQVAMIQPAGNANFDSGCFRLMSVDVTGTTGFTAGLTTSTDDRLYFTGVNGASSNTATVVYYFKMLCSGASTVANPFSDLTSGGQQKYTGNFGFCTSAKDVCPSYPPPTNPFVITKTASPANLPSGGAVTYTVTITNPSPYAAKIDKIVDTLPAGVAFTAIGGASGVTAANSSSMPAAGATGTITFAGIPTSSCVGGVCNGTYSIAANATLTLVYSANVTSNPGVYTNSARAMVETTSIGPATSNVTVGSADIGITKTASSGTPNVNSNVTFTISATNNGPSAASGVQVTDLLPSGLQFVSATAPGATTYNSATGVWNIGPLANGATVSLQIVATVTQPGAITNSASVTASNPTDTNNANNSASATVNGQQADLAVTKTVNNPNVPPGSNMTYTVMVTNNGPSGATSVQVTDMLPAGLTYISHTASQGSYSTATGLWSVGALANGASATLAITVRVDSAASITNSAGITAPAQYDPVSANNGDSVTTPSSLADLAVTKTVSPGAASVNTNVTFTVQVANNGPTAASGVQLTDLLPGGLVFVSATPSVGSYTTATGVWNVGGLANGASATLQIVATVTQPGAITNQAGVTASDQADPNAANDTASATLTGQQADLVITKTADNATPNVGANVSYSIEVTNGGPSATTGIQVTDLLPNGLAFVSASASQGTYTSATGIWNVGTLANGASATLQIVATVNQPGSLTNTATISASSIYDPNSANNSASATVTGQQADLAVAKSVSTSTPNVGSNVTFTIQITNNGPNTATGVLVTDLLAAGLTFVSASASAGSYNSATGIWNVGTLNSASSATLALVATVTSGGQVTNTATITSSNQPDPNTANNSSSVVVTGQQADLAIGKSVSNATPSVGATVAFTVQISNNGPSDTTGVEVTDALPAGLTFISASTATGTYNSATGIWSLGALANGATASLTINARVDTAGSLTNTASVTKSDLFDPTAANNSGSASLNGQQADLDISKFVNLEAPNVGENVTYSIQVSNSGPNTATGIQVTDLLPAGLTFVSASASQGAYTSATGIWNVGSLANGASATLQIVATVTQPGSISNSATITASDQPDPDSTNNTSTATMFGHQAELAVTKTVDNTTPNVGANVTYTIEVTNNGPSIATGIQVTDLLPNGLAFVSASASAGSYNSATGIWTIDMLENGSSATLQIVARVTQPGQITNTAAITGSDLPDPTPGNNTSTSTVTAPSADLAVTKVVSNATPAIGGMVIYTISAHNNGPNSASGVQVTDKLPAGVTFVSAMPSQGTYNPGTGIWSVNSLENSATATLTIQVQINAVGTIVNVAQISAADQFDPNSTPANNAPTENDQSQVSLAVQPTAILLASFTAHSSGAGVLLNWRTTLELDTWGFEIYRSSTGQRDDAVRVTATLIPAQARGQAGAEYAWLDTTAQPGTLYRYWLVEVDRNGTRTEYGPASSATGAGLSRYMIALPLIAR